MKPTIKTIKVAPRPAQRRLTFWERFDRMKANLGIGDVTAGYDVVTDAQGHSTRVRRPDVFTVTRYAEADWLLAKARASR